MPTPKFILDLRKKVGHDLLLLPGLIAVVVDERGWVLLNLRSDTKTWSVISGILEPDEDPRVAIEREVLEETSVVVRAEKLIDAFMSPRITYPNGDQSQYLTVVYRCSVVSGEPRAADEESLEVKYFDPDNLPPLREDILNCIRRALSN